MIVDIKLIDEKENKWHIHKKFTIYALDIETHMDDKTIEKASDKKHPDYSRIGMWCGYFIKDFHDEDFKNPLYWAHNESELITRIDTALQQENILCFIFNASFDLSYLLPYLVQKYGLDNMEFNCKTQLSTIYEVKINYHNHHLIFRDLRLLLGGGSLAGHSGPKGFNCTHQKEVDAIDYKLDRHTTDGSLYKPTDIELEYNYYDVASMLEIIQDYYNKLDTPEHYYGYYFFNSVSAASYSVKLCMADTYGVYAKDDIFYTEDTKTGSKKYDSQHKKGALKCKKYRLTNNDIMKRFRAIYPKLNKEEEEFLRLGYHGGLCYPFYNYARKTIHQRVAHIDAASMYPSQMILNEYPYGHGKQIDPSIALNRQEHTLTAIKIKYSYGDIDESAASFIPDIGNTHYREAWTTCPPEGLETVIWAEIELDFYKKLPGFTFKILDAYRFKSKFLDQKDYIQKIFDLKRSSEGANRQRYKIVMNSLYGKFGERTHEDECIVNMTGGLLSTEMVALDTPRTAKFQYLPIASCATAYARKELLSIMSTVGYENVVYCDTDSVFFVINKKSLAGWKTLESGKKIGKNVGQWEFDGYYINFAALCPKKYKGLMCKVKELTDEASIENSYFDVKYAGCNIKDISFDETGVDNIYETTKTLKTPKGNLILLSEGEVKRETFLEANVDYNENTLNDNDKYVYLECLKQQKEKQIKNWKGTKKGLEKCIKRIDEMILGAIFL